jgi:putative membrane protein
MHPEAVAIAGLLAGAWIAAWRQRPDAVHAGHALAFAAAVAALAAASVGPLHDLAERSYFAAHMVQHLLLTLVVPAGLLAGTPAFMQDALLAPLARRPVPAAVVWRITRPVPALALHACALVAWHLPAAYRLALESQAWHLAQHASLAGTALLAWWPVLGASRHAPSQPHGAQLLYLFVFGMPMTVVAAMITVAEQVLYPSVAAVPLADQRLGGLIMWVPAGLVPLTAFTAVFFRWVAADWDPPEAAESSP